MFDCGVERQSAPQYGDMPGEDPHQPAAAFAHVQSDINTINKRVTAFNENLHSGFAAVGEGLQALVSLSQPVGACY